MKEIALIWMSAGNSYFDEKTIGKLLKFADKRFQRILVISPDKPAEHTFKALGYPDNKARRKAKLNANLLINRAKRELQKIKGNGNFQFVNWEGEVVNNQDYLKKYREILYLYKNNVSFRDDARETTKKVIEDKSKDAITMETAIDEAVFYLIEELSFVLSCPSIYRVDNISYLYHQNWEIYEEFIKGKYDGKKRDNFSFILTGIK
ncbi:MAG: hypothetical protein RL557_1008 [archaeon]|jgi:cyclo(L-tyrosyl-L-tyrosyl) synthase